MRAALRSPPSPPSPWLRRGLLCGAALALLDGLAVARTTPPPDQLALVVLASAGVLVPLGAALGLLGRALGRLLPARVPRVPGVWIVLALGLFYLDTSAYRRLYPLAHGLLLLLTATALLLATAGWQGRPPRRRTGLCIAAAVAALVGAGQAVLRGHPEVRHLAYHETTAASQLLSVLARAERSIRAPAPVRPAPRPSPPQPPPASPASIDEGGGPPALDGAHLVIVSVDALRADRVHARRDGRPLMPGLAALAARSVEFRRAYAATPHTAYSLGSLFTGSPLRTLTELQAPLPHTLAEHLADHGYRTLAIVPDGLFFNGRGTLAPYARSHFGFAERRFHDGTAAGATALAQAALEELRRDGEPSTLLWVHYFDPHEPYEPHPAHDFGPWAVDRYDGEVATVDEELARLTEALQRLQRQVVLVLTADHGEEFNDHGGHYHGSALYDEQVRVPLLLAAPGLAPKKVEPAVSLMDLAPTLLRLIAAPPLPGAGGRDLGPLLIGQPGPGHPVVAEVDTQRMVVRGGFKLIHDQLRDTWELYDLTRDPLERINQYRRRPEIARGLTAALTGWLDQVHGQASEPEPIARGRIGDRRAVPALSALLGDRARPPAQRAEAARLLGALEAGEERPALARALDDAELAVRAEAALALAQLFDLRAVPVLSSLLSVAEYRPRAAIQLGRLRQPGAVPALIATLGSPRPAERRQAAVYLGRVGDASAIAPLLQLRSDTHAAKDAALALGRIGARTHAAQALPEMLAWLQTEEREDVIAELCHGLAALGDARAIPALLEVLRRAPSRSWAAEALVRLGILRARADQERPIGGVDLGPGLGPWTRGFSACQKRDAAASEDRLGGGTCRLAGGPGRLTLVLSPVAGPYLLLLRLAPGPMDLRQARLQVRLNGVPLSPVGMQPGWQEVQVPVEEQLLRRGRNEVELRLHLSGPRRGAPYVVLDRLLLMPR